MSATGSMHGEASSNRFDLNRVLMWMAIISAIPIAFLYLSRMWVEGHYQFFPLYIAVVGYLYFDRFQQISEGTNPGQTLLSLVLLGISSLLILAGILLESAFLGAVSLYSLSGSVIYWLLGKQGLANSLPFLLLLLLAIPLPANVDNLIIVKLQFLASQFAGGILDLFGLIHFREGVILITHQQQFFTEEACSGIRSLYSSIAGMAVYCVVCRYGWARSTFTIVQTFFWVIFGNALRIAIVVWVSSSYTTAIAEGLGHDLLGLAIFVVIMLFAISTDRLIASMLPHPENEVDDDNVIDSKPIVSWNQIWKRLKTATFAPALAFLFLMVFVVGCRMTYVRLTQDESLTSLTSRRLPTMSKEDMPDEIGSWNRVGFERIRRGHSSIFAQDSFAWEYQDASSGLTAVLSVDCPWHEFHDLVICYEVKGWRRNGESVIESDQLKFKSVDLGRFEGAIAYLMYAGVDRNGVNIRPPSATDTFDAATRLTAGIRQLLGMEYSDQIEASNYELPFSMIQVYCEPTSSTRTSDQELLQEFFRDAYRQVIQSNRYQQQPGT